MLQCVHAREDGAQSVLAKARGGEKMSLYLTAALALIFTICGALIYRLGIGDGVSLKKSGELLSKRKEEKESADSWQSIIGYDHTKKC